MVNDLRVLVIDDEDMIRDVIKTVLTGAGYQVSEAADGSIGLKILESESFDLVITDILMPEKEGIETIMEIKRTYPDLRIVAISGGGRGSYLFPLKIADTIGAERCLPKPFEPEDLLNAVREATSGGAADPQVQGSGA